MKAEEGEPPLPSNLCEEIEKEEEEEEEEEPEPEPRVLERNEIILNVNLSFLREDRGKLACRRLDVSDKNLTDVSILSDYVNLWYVNVSKNKLTSDALRVFEKMPDLRVLNADGNRLTSAKFKPMDNLETISKMQLLNLKHNKLTSVDTSDISHKSLKRLELDYNRIGTVAFEVEKLPNLKTLKLSGNRLITTTVFKEIHSNLTELFLDNNKIKNIEHLRYLTKLTKLHLQNNQLANLDGFSAKCQELKYINLRKNQISKISELKKLSCLKKLRELIILENCCLKKIKETEKTKYFHVVLMMLPTLNEIDEIKVEDSKDPEIRCKEEAKELLEKMRKVEYSFTDFDKEFNLADLENIEVNSESNSK